MHTRKTSRIDTNKDLMTALLMTSDPYISNIRKNTTTKPTDFLGIEEYVVTSSSPDSYYSDLLTSTTLNISDSEEGVTEDSD